MKVCKLQPKIDFCEKNLKKVVNLSFPNSSRNESFEDWRVCGAIVIEGYGGIFSGRPDHPRITSDVLKIGLSEIDNLEPLIEWIRSLVWLPQMKVHFKDEMQVVGVDASVIQYPGIRLLDAAPRYSEYAHQSAQSFKR